MRFLVSDPSATTRQVGHLFVSDASGTTRQVARGFVSDASGTTRQFFPPFTSQIVTYNAAGTYTPDIPSGANTMMIEVWGPSGNGGAADKTTAEGGGGGNGGYGAGVAGSPGQSPFVSFYFTA